MIIICLFIFAIGFFLFNVLPLGKHSHLIAICSLILFIASGTLTVLNDTYHLGMEVKTTTVTKPLISSFPKSHILLYQKLGNGKEKVYLYKTKRHQKKLKPCETDKMQTKISLTNKKPKLQITEEYYEYRPGIPQFWFSLLKNGHVLKQRTYHFYLNQDWLILNTKQAKTLAKTLKDPREKARLNSLVAKKVQQSLAAKEMAPKTLKELKEQALHDVIQNELKKFA